MADDRVNLPRRSRIFDRAVWMKWNRYAISGFLITFIGLIITVVAVMFTSQAYSNEALIVGLGIVVMVVGVIRLLIGFINPVAPLPETPHASDANREERLHEAIFEEPPPEDRAAE